MCSLQMWQEESQKTEASLKQQFLCNDLIKENMPPVRGSNLSVPLSKVYLLLSLGNFVQVLIILKSNLVLCQNVLQKEKRNPCKRSLPRDYREWDK